MRDAIVSEARTWLGTPFVHAARIKGVGVDCVGLVVGVAHALGLSDYETPAYSMQPDRRAMLREIEAQLSPSRFSDIGPGDVLWLRVAGNPQHLAIVTDMRPFAIIHSFAKVGRVVENEVGQFWRSRIAGAYRFWGVA